MVRAYRNSPFPGDASEGGTFHQCAEPTLTLRRFPLDDQVAQGVPSMAKDGEQSTLPSHGASVLPSVRVESHNVEVEDDDGFIGDKASKGASWEIFDKWREPLRKISEDPFGDMPTREDNKKRSRNRPRRGRTGSLSPRAKCSRRVCTAARESNAPVPQAEGLVRGGVRGDGRRFPW